MEKVKETFPKIIKILAATCLGIILLVALSIAYILHDIRTPRPPITKEELLMQARVEKLAERASFSARDLLDGEWDVLCCLTNTVDPIRELEKPYLLNMSIDKYTNLNPVENHVIHSNYKTLVFIDTELKKLKAYRFEQLNYYPESGAMGECFKYDTVQFVSTKKNVELKNGKTYTRTERNVSGEYYKGK